MALQLILKIFLMYLNLKVGFDRADEREGSASLAVIWPYSCLYILQFLLKPKSLIDADQTRFLFAFLYNISQKRYTS